MKKTGSLVILYSALVFIGGLMGYLKAQSIPSLISGSFFGLVLVVSAIAMIKKKKWGQWSALAIAFLLDAFFTYRFAKTLKFIPSGLMSLISLIMIIILALRINMANNRR
jgi:uncharacterized membrane protein (UPF0136 family)